MKPSDKPSEKIKLTQTFFSIEKGELTAAQAAAKKRAEKEAKKADIIKKGGVPDRTDPFISNFSK